MTQLPLHDKLLCSPSKDDVWCQNCDSHNLRSFNATRYCSLCRDITTWHVGMYGKPSTHEYCGKKAPYDVQNCRLISNTHGHTLVIIWRCLGTKGMSDEQENKNDSKIFGHVTHERTLRSIRPRSRTQIIWDVPVHRGNQHCKNTKSVFE